MSANKLSRFKFIDSDDGYALFERTTPELAKRKVRQVLMVPFALDDEDTPRPVKAVIECSEPEDGQDYDLTETIEVAFLAATAERYVTSEWEALAFAVAHIDKLDAQFIKFLHSATYRELQQRWNQTVAA